MSEVEVNVLTPKRTWLQVTADAVGGIWGWRVDVDPALPKKCVVVGAPHTSNMDLFAGFLMMLSAPVRLHWLGKDSLFRFPLVGGILKATGGIPVNRRERTNFVEQMAKRFEEAESLRLTIAPSGTRKKTDHWKTGFYHIAVAAKVPLAYGYVDYGRKVVGISRGMMPTGDIEADMEHIRAFYADIEGKFPANKSDIRLNPKR